MKLQKHKQLLRGVAATAAALLTLSTVAYGVAKSDLAIGWVDGFFGINDRTIYHDWVEKVEDTVIEGEPGWVNLPGRPHQMDHDTVNAYAEALRAHAIRQGEEGFALLKNDNDALPLNKSAAGSNVALFGWNAYNMPSGHTGVVAGNGRPGRGQTESTDRYAQITLKDAFDSISGITVNNTITADQFTGAMAGPSRGGGWGGGSATPWKLMNIPFPRLLPAIR